MWLYDDFLRNHGDTGKSVKQLKSEGGRNTRGCGVVNGWQITIEKNID